MSRKHYIIPVFVPHIGCPHDCVFCNQNTITGKKDISKLELEEITENTVKNTIETYLKTINLKKDNDAIIEVSFFGGTFTAIEKEKQEELLNVAYKYKKNHKIRYIRLSTRPDYIDEEELNLLKKYSVDIIELGVQSLNEEVLKCSGRGHSVEIVKKSSKLIRDFEFVLGIQIMLGLPKDDIKKDIITALKVVEIKPDIARIYPALVIKDTPMETMFLRGDYKPYDLGRSVEICKLIYSIFISNNINVVRVGLQPTEEINNNAELVAGPFHPAFRELVESSLLNEMIYTYIERINIIDKDTIYIKINPKNISKLYSNKRYYFNYYLKNIQSIKVIQEDIDKDKIIINYKSKDFILSYGEFLKEKFLESKKFL